MAQYVPAGLVCLQKCLILNQSTGLLVNGSPLALCPIELSYNYLQIIIMSFFKYFLIGIFLLSILLGFKYLDQRFMSGVNPKITTPILFLILISAIYYLSKAFIILIIRAFTDF